MPGNPTITLVVVNSASSPGAGYTETTASNGGTYWYLYTGGDNNGGNVTFTSRGPVTIVVQLQSASNFSINTVGFTGDVNNQLSTSGNSATNITIHNKNNAVQTAEYKVTVSDSTAGCTVPCDPTIINR